MGKFYMLRDGVRVGPLDPQEMLRQGLTRSTQVWREGMEGYAPASAVPELAAVEGGLPPDAPTPSSGPPGPGTPQGEPAERFTPGCSPGDFRFGLILPLTFIVAGVVATFWMADKVLRGEMREQSMFLPWGFTFLALLVYHFNWFKLVYRGWKLLRSHSPRMGSGAGVAWALVPIVNLYGRFYSVCGLVSDLNRVRAAVGRAPDAHLLPLAIFTIAIQTPLPFVKLATAGTNHESLFYAACLVLAPFELAFFYRLRASCRDLLAAGASTAQGGATPVTAQAPGALQSPRVRKAIGLLATLVLGLGVLAYPGAAVLDKAAGADLLPIAKADPYSVEAGRALWVQNGRRHAEIPLIYGEPLGGAASYIDPRTGVLSYSPTGQPRRFLFVDERHIFHPPEDPGFALLLFEPGGPRPLQPQTLYGLAGMLLVICILAGAVGFAVLFVTRQRSGKLQVGAPRPRTRRAL